MKRQNETALKMRRAAEQAGGKVKRSGSTGFLGVVAAAQKQQTIFGKLFNPAAGDAPDRWARSSALSSALSFPFLLPVSGFSCVSSVSFRPDINLS